MKKIFLSIMFTLAVFSLAACDSDSEDTIDLNVSQGVTEDTITVGNAAGTSGQFAEVGEPFNSAIRSYFEMVNDNGGVAGRDIEFIHYDDESDAELGLNYVQELVEDDEVFSIVGHLGTPTVEATRDYLTSVGIPRVYYATGVSTLFNPEAEGGERTSFPVQPIYDAEGEVMVARILDEFDADEIGVIYTDDDAGTGMFGGIEKQAEELDITINAKEVGASDVDMSSAARDLSNSDADAIIVASNQAPAKIAIQDLETEGNTKPVVTSYVNADASFLGDIPSIVQDEPFDLYASAWIDINDPEGENGFSDEYWTFAETVDEEYASNAYAMAGWIAADVFVQGLERVDEDELTWKTYMEAMEEEPVNNPFGGIVDFSDGNRVGTQAMSWLEATASQDDEDEWTYDWATVRDIEDISEILN